jgi:hypothetical protein
MLVKLTPERRKVLPCLTICPLSAFKTAGFFFTNQMYEENAFKLEDTFDSVTALKLRNSSQFLLKVSV